MKYIRLKSFITDFASWMKIDGDILSIGGAEHKIIAQADTVEELCDGFIITSKQGHIYDSYGDYNYELKEVLPQARKECPDEDWDLYGCVLVNGIIKQVAKLNDEKGELELL